MAVDLNMLAPADGPAFWRAAAGDPGVWWAAGLVGVSLLGVIGTALILWRVESARHEGTEARRHEGVERGGSRPNHIAPRMRGIRRIRAVFGDARGTATIEFALLFPILLFFVLLLTQTTMLLAGHVVVHYSAFAATRTAIVEIPRAVDGDPPNVYTQRDGRWKRERIRAAAAFANLPIAGREGAPDAGPVADDLAAAFSDFYGGYGADEPPWVQGMLADKLNYALANTETRLFTWHGLPDGESEFREIRQGGSHEFGTRDPITVRVSHRLNLGVPYVNRIFSDGRNPSGDGEYTLVTAQYTLTNEGVRDALPPEPTIPRLSP